MSVATIDTWNIYAGDDEAISLTFRRGGQPVDMTMWEGWQAHWRPHAADESAVPLDIDTTRLAEGIIRVAIPGSLSATDGGVVRSGVWDVQAHQGELTRTFVRGRVSWTQDVTR